MRDAEIRTELVALLQAEEPEAAIYHELPLLRGRGKADLVLVNGCLSGFEIKSERDTVDRLPGQIGTYSQVFEYSSVVFAEKHLKRIRAIVPGGWGLMIAKMHGDELTFSRVRKPRRSQTQPDAVVRLLWRSELCSILRRYGAAVDSKSLTHVLWREAKRLPRRALIQEVRDALKRRAGISVAERPVQGGD